MCDWHIDIHHVSQEFCAHTPLHWTHQEFYTLIRQVWRGRDTLNSHTSTGLAASGVLRRWGNIQIVFSDKCFTLRGLIQWIKSHRTVTGRGSSLFRSRQGGRLALFLRTQRLSWSLLGHNRSPRREDVEVTMYSYRFLPGTRVCRWRE